MLYWTIVFLAAAFIAGVLGFTGVAVAAAGIAKLVCFHFPRAVCNFPGKSTSRAAEAYSTW